MTEMLERAGELIWGPWTVLLTMAAGLWFSGTNGWLQVGAVRKICRTIRTSLKDGGDGISPLQSTTAALAGTLGTGNIVGVAAAIYAGGAGAVFWMWAAAFLGMMTAYAENVLGIIYRRRGGNGEWLGGPMYYMERGIGAKRLAAVWAALCAFSAFGVGNMIQINTIASSARAAWSIPPWLTGLIVAAAAAPVILGGMKSLVRLTEKLIPLLAGLYLLACAAVLVMCADRVPAAFLRIFTEAFCPKAAAGGFLGCMLTGVRRGVFTNEAGMGSSVLMQSAAEVKHPSVQGVWGMFEVFFDTIVMCSLTALTMLSAGADAVADPSGAIMTAAAFAPVFGRLSGSFVALSLLFFAYATIIGWGCCGERAFAYIAGEKAVTAFRWLYVLMLIPGAVVRVEAAWALSDLLNGLMAIPNTIAVLLLWREVSVQTDDFFRGRRNVARKLRPTAGMAHHCREGRLPDATRG